MVRDHPVRRPVTALGRHAGQFHAGGDEMAEDVDVIIVVDALEHRGDALEPHAGVDRGRGQRHARAVGPLVVLHEDEIPDLDIAVAVGLRTAGRAARHLGTVVVEDLGTGPAGPGITHRPEIVAGRDPHDPLLRQAGDPPPQGEGLVVLVVDRHPKALLRQPEDAVDELPRVLDRALLEIVAEGEVPQHLEEGVMARRVADIVEIVVLAAGAHAFLRGSRTAVGALFQPPKDVLERDHAGIREQKRGVVRRHERGGGNHLMAALTEEVQERLADLVARRHRDLPVVCGPQPAASALRSRMRRRPPAMSRLARAKSRRRPPGGRTAPHHP